MSLEEVCVTAEAAMVTYCNDMELLHGTQTEDEHRVHACEETKRRKNDRKRQPPKTEEAQ